MADTTTQQRQTPQEIWTAIEQLEFEEAEQLARRLLQMQARRKSPHLPAREATLLEEIYRGKRPGFQARFDELHARRRAGTLTAQERDELLALNDESEAFTLRRLQALAELAHLQRLPLSTLLRRLGLKAPPVA